MAKSKFKVTKGLAQMVTTGEPVLVTGFTTKENPPYVDPQDVAVIVRAVVTQNGIEHRKETVPLDYLETRFEQAKRHVELENFVQDLREEAANKRYTLSPDMKAALRANKAGA